MNHLKEQEMLEGGGVPQYLSHDGIAWLRPDGHAGFAGGNDIAS
jgi:hypothetical protein